MAPVSGAWGPPQVGGLYPCGVRKEAPESRAAGLGRPKTASSRGDRSAALDQHLPSHVLSPQAPSRQKATPSQRSGMRPQSPTHVHRTQQPSGPAFLGPPQVCPLRAVSLREPLRASVSSLEQRGYPRVVARLSQGSVEHRHQGDGVSGPTFQPILRTRSCSKPPPATGRLPAAGTLPPLPSTSGQ